MGTFSTHVHNVHGRPKYNTWWESEKENERVQLRLHGGIYWAVFFDLRFLPLHVLNIWLSHGKKHPLFVHGNHLSSREHYTNSLHKKLLVSSRLLLCWLEKERSRTLFNHLLIDIVEAPSQRTLEFVEARQLLRILPNYGLYGNNYKILHWCKVLYLY